MSLLQGALEYRSKMAAVGAMGSFGRLARPMNAFRGRPNMSNMSNMPHMSLGATNGYSALNRVKNLNINNKIRSPKTPKFLQGIGRLGQSIEQGGFKHPANLAIGGAALLSPNTGN